MKDKAEKLIMDFKLNGWKTEYLYERLFDLAVNSNDAFFFATEFLKTFDKSATIFNDILSYIDRIQFKELINLALDILKNQKNENADSVIEYASLQFPELLHNDLELIFELKPNEKTYYADYPWRNLDTDKIQILKSKLVSSKTGIEDKEKLFRCLLETRNFEAVTFAYKYVLNNKPFSNDNLEEYLIAHLELVGYTKRNDNIENYCPSTPRNLSFMENYFSSDKPIHLNKEQHPTWNLKPDGTKYTFGGIFQDDEKNPLIHLITFDNIPKGIKITGMARLTLGMHIRELNEYGAIFYQHDSSGKPIKIGDIREIEFYSDLPINETEISFSETSSR